MAETFSIYDNFLDAVFIYNHDKQIVYCNEACATLIDVSLRRLKPGKFVYDFLNFEDDQIFFMPSGEMGKDGPMKFREIPYTTRQEKKGIGLITIAPLSNSVGEKLWLAVVRDVTLEIQLAGKYRTQLEEKENIIVELRSAKDKLEDYSQNLEKMVEARTNELRRAHSFLNTMVNSLDQGLMVFNKENVCLPIYTKVCEDLFGVGPANKKIWDVLNLDESEKNNFEKWSKCVFDEIIPFKDMLPLSLNHLTNVGGGDGKYINLDYFSMHDEDNQLQGVVTVATDKTAEVQAKEAFEKKNAYVKMILKLVQNKDQFLSFVRDSRKMLSAMEEALKDSSNVFKDSEMMRLLHSVKGGAALYSIKNIHDLVEVYETEFLLYKNKKIEEQQEYLPQLAKNIKYLSNNFNLFCEGCRSFLGDMIQDGEARVEIKEKFLMEFEKKLKLIDNDELLDYFNESFLKVPIIKYFSFYSDLVTTMGERMDKPIHPISFIGGETKVIQEKFQPFFNSFVHLFRNCIDHGLEDKRVRLERRKDAKGSIKVDFAIGPGITAAEKQLEIVVEDDGAGIDPNSVRQKLVEMGAEKRIIQEDDSQIIYHIFDSFFTTRKVADEISGRGVGMSAIKEEVDKLKGQIELYSEVGKGTKFTFIVPL